MSLVQAVDVIIMAFATQICRGEHCSPVNLFQKILPRVTLLFFFTEKKKKQVTALAVFTEICFDGCEIAYITGRFASLGNAVCQLCCTDSAVVCFSGSENVRNDDFIRAAESFPKFIKEETGTGESMRLEHTPCGVVLHILCCRKGCFDFCGNDKLCFSSRISSAPSNSGRVLRYS